MYINVYLRIQYYFFYWIRAKNYLLYLWVKSIIQATYVGPIREPIPAATKAWHRLESVSQRDTQTLSHHHHSWWSPKHSMWDNFTFISRWYAIVLLVCFTTVFQSAHFQLPTFQSFALVPPKVHYIILLSEVGLLFLPELIKSEKVLKNKLQSPRHWDFKLNLRGRDRGHNNGTAAQYFWNLFCLVKVCCALSVCSANRKKAIQ